MEKKRLKPGERGFGIILIIISILAIFQSVGISGAEITPTSPGAFPLFISTISLMFAIWIWAEKRSLSSQKHLSIWEKSKSIVKMLISKDIAVMIIFLFIYSLVLEYFGFEISTFLFLWVSMVFLARGKVFKSFGVSLFIISIILVIFKTIFKVILP